MERIIIKQEYFTNIQTAINSLNEFFSSEFKTKNFPVLDGDFQLDPTVEKILSWLSSVDPTWLTDEAKVTSIIDTINEGIKTINPVDGVYETIVNSNNETMIQAIDAYIGLQVLNTIARNFDDFTKFINGIYTFEIFSKPSVYTDVLDIFTQPIDLTALPDLDLEERIFSEQAYVEGVMKNEQIIVPEDMDGEKETERIIARGDLKDCEILVDDSVQEAAEVNYFENTTPSHIKYSPKKQQLMISQQFTKLVDDLISGLRGCDTTESLKAYLETYKTSDIEMLADTTIPFILAKAFSNPKKYPSADQVKDVLKNYIDSYNSILNNNNGAKRFTNYDIFSTFKADKEGTISFIEDFLKLKLVNNADAAIENNTLMTLFNIFDSRIYLDIMYNMTPDKQRNGKGEDAFVKEIRGNINKNSHTKTAYSNDENKQETEEPTTTETVSEYVSHELNKFGNEITLSDMTYCEQFSDLVNYEINTLDDRTYNHGLSQFLIEEYIGESFDTMEVIMEATSADNRQRLAKIIYIIIPIMEQIKKSGEKNSWTNNDCFSILSSNVMNNIKQCRKYLRRAMSGCAGALTDSQISVLKSIAEKLDEIIKWRRIMKVNPLTQKNIKESYAAHKILDAAKEITIYSSDLDFVKESPKKELPKEKEGNNDEVTAESVNYSIDMFAVFMEQETGEIPDYMKTRFKLSDDISTTVTPADLPEGVPQNPVEDMTGSINTKLDNGDGLDSSLGLGYEENKDPKTGDKGIVVNITNNYTNSFNRNSNNSHTVEDHSTGKTSTTTHTNSHNKANSDNDNSTNKRSDTSNNKRIKSSNSRKSKNSIGSNNTNNSNASSDTKDIMEKDGEQVLSSGKTIQEMFMILESKEPQSGSLSSSMPNSKPPKEDSLTKAMDADRKSLPVQQKAKRGVTKIANTGKALLKPVTRTKQWLTKVVDSLIKRDEDQVKAEIMDNPSYRSAIIKAARLAKKLGLVAVATAIQPWLGIAVGGTQILKAVDKHRLKGEVARELSSEIEIMDEKIRDLEHSSDPEKQKLKYKLMRQRKKMEDSLMQTPASKIKHPKDTW